MSTNLYTIGPIIWTQLHCASRKAS